MCMYLDKFWYLGGIHSFCDFQPGIHSSNNAGAVPATFPLAICGKMLKAEKHMLK